MNTRILGTLCIIGSLVAVLDALRLSVIHTTDFDFDTLTTIVIMIWAIGCIAALVAMIQLNAVGASVVARSLAFVPIIGFALLVLLGVLGLAGFMGPNHPVYSIAWLVQLAGMLLVGILTIAAKTWRGWRRFVPLLCIALVPVGFGLGATINNLSLGAAIIYAIWILLGYVVAIAEAAPSMRQTPAA